MKWIERQRAEFILDRLSEHGIVRRGDLEEHFGVSLATASKAFTWFQGEFPGAMRYDLGLKAYVAGPQLPLYRPEPSTFE